MWIFPVSPEEQAHPVTCEDCGAAVIRAKTQAGKDVSLNPGFKVLETLEFGEDGYLQLLADEASHARTCEKKAGRARPAMTRKRGARKHVDI